MPFIGNTPDVNFTSFAKQTITGNGGTSYTLSHAVANENEVEIFVNNVRQEGGSGKAYTVNGTALTMTGNVANTDSFYVIFLGKALQTTVPPDGSVSTAKIADDAVNLTSKVTGILPTGNGGTGSSTGVTANSMIDIFTFHNSTTAVQLANGEFVNGVTRDTRLGVGTLNTGMSLNESNSRWTFPSTGYYLVRSQVNFFSEGSSHDVQMVLSIDNGSTSDDHQGVRGSVDTSTRQGNLTGEWILNISNTNITVRIRFDMSANTKLRTGTTKEGSTFTFIKLA